MDDNKKKLVEMRIQKTAEALRKNGMDAVYAPTRKEAIEFVAESLEEGSVVTCGGSVTLQECGIMNLLRNGMYEFLDRSGEQVTAQFRNIQHGLKRRRELPACWGLLAAEKV